MPFRMPAHDVARAPIGAVQLWHDVLSIPRGWLLCDGSYIPGAAYPKLLQLLATTYGAYVDNTFALPDLGSLTLGSQNMNFIINAY